MPVHEELGVEISEDSFILYIIPDDLKFTSLANLVEAFDKFEVTFMPNSYNFLKLNLSGLKKPEILRSCLLFCQSVSIHMYI